MINYNSSVVSVLVEDSTLKVVLENTGYVLDECDVGFDDCRVIREFPSYVFDCHNDFEIKSVDEEKLELGRVDSDNILTFEFE